MTENIPSMKDSKRDLDSMPTLLRMENISKSFLGVKVLDQVDFAIDRAEVLAFLGANGAGKSTLMKILCGVYHADEGRILLNEKKVSFNNPLQAYGAGISVVHQESSLIPTLTIIENLFLGREYTKPGGVLDEEAMLKEYDTLCLRFGLSIAPSTKVRDLSPANKKMTEIMKAVSRKSSILIMDEPTDALSSQEITRLFEIVSELKSRGMSIIFITHFLDEVKSIADSATVIRDGKIVADHISPSTPIKDIVSLMLGKQALERQAYVKAALGPVMMEVKDLMRRNEFSNVSFELRAGEVLGLVGVVGSGKTELARTLFGASQSHGGEIRLGGRQVRFKNPSQAVKQGMGMAPEDRKTLGLILEHDIESNISLSSLGDTARHGFINGKKEKKRAVDVAGRLSIKYVDLKQKIKFLSGGNQQKCVLARWLLASPQVLVLDEPTRGIDVATKEQIYAIVRDLAAHGKSVLYLSGDPAEVMIVADRVMVLSLIHI